MARLWRRRGFPFSTRTLRVPDTLEGRFLVLSLHLFAVLHRLKAEEEAALGLAQELTDRFSEDMETVLQGDRRRRSRHPEKGEGARALER